MAGIKDFWEWCDDFFGAGTFGTSASEGADWVLTDTSASGSPTVAKKDHGTSSGAPGVAQLGFSSDTEVQNLCLSWGDKLALDIDLIREVEFRVQQGQATKDAATTLAFGLAGNRNDAIDSIAQAALFRLASGSADNSVVVETDDGTNNNDDKSTGESLSNSWKRFVISFENGKSDVRFYMEDSNGALTRVASGTTFDMSNYSGCLQPFIQLQKTSDNNTDSVEIDYVKVRGVRGS